jgi:uncharacterized repeat protein (TIGR01451 family)
MVFPYSMPRGTAGGRLAALLMTGTAFAFAAQPAMAAGTRAGTTISNTATATFDNGAGTQNVSSNTVDMKVDELLNVTVASNNPADVTTTPGATGQVLSYTVTNTGNGVESFRISSVANVGGDNYDPTVTSIVIDNGNGVYEPGVDTVYVAGTNDPNLNPDASVTIFVVATTPGGVVDGNRGIVELVANANTGTGTPGTSFAGQGEGGGDAVVGATGATGKDRGAFVVSTAAVTLAKSATVADTLGGTEPIPGATITYTITATVTGSGSVTGLTISDNIPANTTFVPASITLGGVTQTDTADGDAGRYVTTPQPAVIVALGTVAGGNVRTVTFQVKIN